MLTHEVLVFAYDQDETEWMPRGQAVPGKAVDITSDGQRIATVMDDVVLVYDFDATIDMWVLETEAQGTSVRLTDVDRFVVYDATEKSIDTWGLL